MKQRVVIISFLTVLASLWLDCAIAAKPRISIAALKAQAAEKGALSGQFQLVSDAPVSKALTVSYAIGGNAKVGKDYKKIKAKTTIRAGQSVAYIDVVPVADKKAEKPETVKLVLKNGRNYLRGNARSASIQITDEPVPGAGGSGGGFPSYQNLSLPGRLLVGEREQALGAPKVVAAIYNLRNGTRLNLPLSASSDADDGDTWSVGEAGSTLVRQSTGRYYRTLFSFFNSVSLAQSKPSVDVGTESISIFGSKLSPDGRYLLTFRRTAVGEDTLTIYDTTTGAIVKSGSMLNGMSVISTPAAWLPDGRYVYIFEGDMYVSSPTIFSSQLVARLAIPKFSISSADSNMSVSPDGKQLVFSWRETRGVSSDSYLWVVNTDGTGLRKLTVAPDPNSSLDYFFNHPTWSPDGQWIAAVLERTGNDPINNFPPPGIGTSGCIAQVLVFPASASNVAVAKFPDYDGTYGVKVASADGGSVQWLSSCNVRVSWLP